jgi:O-acetylserine/cysteine efflux transporter
MKPLHLAAALLMVAIWGFNFVVIRWGLNDVPPLTLTGLRFALAALPALFFVVRPRTPWWHLAVYGLFAFALQFALLFSGIAIGMPTGLASLLIQVQAFFTIGLAALIAHERPRPAQLAGALLAAGGIVLVGLHLPGGGTRVGLLCVLAAAASWATANVIVKGMRGEPLAVVVWASAFAALLMVPVALLIEGPDRMAATVASLGALQWVGVAFQAWPTTLLAFGIWAWLLRRYPAALVAPFTLLVPIVGMSCAMWLLGEPVHWWKLAGAALVLGGLALNVASYRRT